MSQIDHEPGADDGRLPSLSDCNAEICECLAGFGFALPYLVVAIGFLSGPLLLGLYMSFYDWNPIFPAESEFIGLGTTRRYSRIRGSGTL